MNKALVVDDSKTIRMILRRMLKEVGFEVCKEALAVMDGEQDVVTLVLADWNMPEMNGLELLKRLRQRSELSSLKVVMVTTEAETGHMNSAMEAGANEYVMKPFTKDILLEKLSRIGVLPMACA